MRQGLRFGSLDILRVWNGGCAGSCRAKTRARPPNIAAIAPAHLPPFVPQDRRREKTIAALGNRVQPPLRIDRPNEAEPIIRIPVFGRKTAAMSTSRRLDLVPPGTT